MDKDTDFRAFSETWIAVYETYGLTISPTVLRLAFVALSAWDVTAVIAAIQRYISDPVGGNRSPTPADIARLLLSCDETESLSRHAWRRVDRGIREVGPWRSITCDDWRILHCIRDLGGWVRLCTIEDEETLAATRPEFERKYAQCLAQSTPAESIRSVVSSFLRTFVWAVLRR